MPYLYVYEDLVEEYVRRRLPKPTAILVERAAAASPAPVATTATGPAMAPANPTPTPTPTP
jgi:hypothetical protein